MSGKRNVLIAQSGGPSPVINASLWGAASACMERDDRFGTVFAAAHGIEGVLTERLIDLSAQDKRELALLPTTPSAGAVGTCRYKLHDGNEDDYRRILEVFRAHDIGTFFYIGGNDSMDTAAKVSKLAAETGYELTVTGIPKTIDNDVGDEAFRLIDHTPGYGSCARYWAMTMQNAEEENRAICVSECVSVYQAMGRRAGFITAAARLGDPERRTPLLMFFCETGHTLPELAEAVNRKLAEAGRCIVVVNEGFDVGGGGVRRDGFGHIEYGASGTTAMQGVVSYLNSVHLAARGQATGQIPGVMQRSCSLFASEVDVAEAAAVARHAVEIALRDGSGWMATILRAPGDVYRAVYDKVRLEDVACSERFLPRSWITADGTDVTDDFVRYARPLIGETGAEIPRENGLQRFARLSPVFAPQRTGPYVPENLRGAAY